MSRHRARTVLPFRAAGRTYAPARALKSDRKCRWTTFRRYEQAGEINADGTRVVRTHLSYSGPMCNDARMKPWYRKEVTCRPEVADTVSRRWAEYFPNGGVEMGDSERGHLD